VRRVPGTEPTDRRPTAALRPAASWSDRPAWALALEQVMRSTRFQNNLRLRNRQGGSGDGSAGCIVDVGAGS
jgi:hypothetical protein